MRTIQLYATGSATGTSVAQITIPSSGTLKGAYVAFSVLSKTDATLVKIELSKVPVSQIAVNGAQDAFLEIGAAGNFVTSGMDLWGQNQYYPLSVACRQGEIIYLHAYVSGTATYVANIIFVY